MALSQVAMCWSGVTLDCVISWSYSLTFHKHMLVNFDFTFFQASIISLLFGSQFYIVAFITNVETISPVKQTF